MVESKLVTSSSTSTEVVTTVTGTSLSPTAIAAVTAGIPANTSRAYTGDWVRFTAWCTATARTALPTDADALTEYATFLMTAGKAPSTIERALSSIAVAHTAAGLPKAATTGARTVLRGYADQRARSTDPVTRPRRAAPATPAALRQMVCALDRSTAAGQRDAAVLLLGFALAARRSELVLLNLTDITETAEGLEVRLYRPKAARTDPVAVPYGANPDTCPVRATRAWRHRLAAAGRETGPLFIRIDRHGRLAHPLHRHGRPIGAPDGRLTGEAIANIVARAAAQARLDRAPDQLLPAAPPRWSGHSLRRGFATAARRAGHDLLRIGRHGGWADGSRALLGYLEDADRWTDNPLIGVGL